MKLRLILDDPDLSLQWGGAEAMVEICNILDDDIRWGAPETEPGSLFGKVLRVASDFAENCHYDRLPDDAAVEHRVEQVLLLRPIVEAMRNFEAANAELCRVIGQNVGRLRDLAKATETHEVSVS